MIMVNYLLGYIYHSLGSDHSPPWYALITNDKYKFKKTKKKQTKNINIENIY